MHRLSLVFMSLLISAVTAQEIAPVDQSKKYGTEPDCGFGDGRGLTLDFIKGIEGVEFHCYFFDIKSAEGSPFLLIEAVCEEPGLRNPDLFSVSPYDATSIEVVSLYDASNYPPGEDNPNPGTFIYHACE